MKLYVSPEATLECVATADIITLSFVDGVGNAISVDLSKYFGVDPMDIGDGL